MSGPAAPRGERDLALLLAGLAPALDPERYVFTRAADGEVPRGLAPVATVREPEALTLVLRRADAVAAGLPLDFAARRLLLTIHSDLAAVGLMARVATALAAAGIPCNTFAGAYHDHLFVPEKEAARALAVLEALSAAGAAPVCYAVTVEVEEDIAAEWLEWMRTVHVPDVLATGCFTGCEFARREDPPPGPGTRVFVLEYRAASMTDLERYRSRHAPTLQQAHTVRYGTRARASRTVRTLLAPPSPA